MIGNLLFNLKGPENMNMIQNTPTLSKLAAIGDAVSTISAALERAIAAVKNLQEVISFSATAEPTDSDPKDPANKYEIGGLEKLTERGIEVCYRLFDAGKSRYAVASLMGISHGGATHRYHSWLKVGGFQRTKQAID